MSCAWRQVANSQVHCENFENGGFARHLEVVLVIPEKTLRLTGGLGPCREWGATGALASTLRSTSSAATTVIAEYSVVGYSREGLASLAGARRPSAG